MKKLILILLAVTVLLGCGKKSSTDSTKDSSSVKRENTSAGNNQSADSLQYEMKSYEKYHKGDPKNKDEYLAVYFKYNYPVIKGGENAAAINKVLQAFILDSIYKSDGVKTNGDMQNLEKSLFKEYDDMMKDRKDYEGGYALDINSDVFYNTAKYISISVNTYMNTGGAHPISLENYLVFDPKTGKQLKLTDIFASGFEKKLDKLIEAQFRKDNKLSPKDKLDEGDVNNDRIFLFENHIEHNDNFIMTKDGITFLYNVYEIAAYAFGPVVIELSYNEIKDILK